jgi:hypothetical protein
MISVWVVENDEGQVIEVFLDEDLARAKAAEKSYRTAKEYKPEITPKVLHQILKIAEEA